MYTNSLIKKEEIETLIVSQTNKTLSMKLATATKGIWAQAVEEGKTQGVTKGITQGKHEKTIEVVRQGWLKGYAIDVIADLSGLTIEEVKTILLNLKKKN